MNIAKLKQLIPASFEYVYLDASDIEQKEIITLSLKRMSFGATATKEFRDAIESDDIESIAILLTDLIGSWNLDLDGEPFEPNLENLKACPTDFVFQLAECVFKRLNANPQKAERSQDGSALPASTATSPAS